MIAEQASIRCASAEVARLTMDGSRKRQIPDIPNSGQQTAFDLVTQEHQTSADDRCQTRPSSALGHFPVSKMQALPSEAALEANCLKDNTGMSNAQAARKILERVIGA